VNVSTAVECAQHASLKHVKAVSTGLRTMANKVTISSLSAFAALALIYLYRSYWITVTSRRYTARSRWVSQSPADPPFEFIPAAHTDFHDCNELFSNDTAAAGFRLSHDFYDGFPAFEAAVKKTTKINRGYSGHSGEVISQFKAIHYLASRSNVHNICETGFNLGHSSYNYLTANRIAIVHSFSLGRETFAHDMASFLRQRFPERFFIHFGNSIKTVPEFVRMHPDHRCDLIFVDGGHYYKAAMSDLINLAVVANVDAGNVIVLDDYPTKTPFPEVGWAWENMRRWGYIRELFRCSFYQETSIRLRLKGFVVGTVVRRPTLSNLQNPIH